MGYGKCSIQGVSHESNIHLQYQRRCSNATRPLKNHSHNSHTRNNLHCLLATVQHRPGTVASNLNPQNFIPALVNSQSVLLLPLFRLCLLPQRPHRGEQHRQPSNLHASPMESVLLSDGSLNRPDDQHAQYDVAHRRAHT